MLLDNNMVIVWKGLTQQRFTELTSVWKVRTAITQKNISAMRRLIEEDRHETPCNCYIYHCFKTRNQN